MQMNRRERYLILTKAYGSEQGPPQANGTRRFRPGGAYVILRDAARLQARSPERIARRGRPNMLSAVESSPLMCDLHPDPEPASPVVPAKSLKAPGRPAKFSRLPDFFRFDAELPEKDDFLRRVEEIKHRQAVREPFLVLIADASAFFAEYGSEPDALQALGLQFSRMTDYAGAEYPRARLEPCRFVSCLPRRLVSNAYLDILCSIPVFCRQRILNVPLNVSVLSLTDGAPVRRYELPGFSARPKIRSLDRGFLDRCFLELTYSAAVDVSTGEPVLEEALPYLVLPGGIAGEAQLVPMLLYNDWLFREFFQLLGLRICERLSGNRRHIPVSLRLSPDFFTPEHRGETLEMIYRASQIFRRLSLPFCSFFFEISSSVISAASDILALGFHTVVYDYPPQGVTLSLSALGRAGVSVVKFSPARVAPDAFAAQMIREHSASGILTVVEALHSTGLAEPWRDVGAEVFQNRFFSETAQSSGRRAPNAEARRPHPRSGGRA